MDRVLVTIGGILYTFLIVFLALSFVLFSSNLHAPFLETASQKTTDEQITRFLLFQGELPEMTANEASHMQDVAWLATTLLYALAGLIAVLTFIFAHAHAEERQAILLAPLLVLLLLQVPLLIFFENFTKAFEQFHQVFFPQGNYAFPYDSVLISTYPETFFSSMAVLCGLLIIGFFLFSLLLAMLTQVHHRMQHIARLHTIHPGLKKLIAQQSVEEKRAHRKPSKPSPVLPLPAVKYTESSITKFSLRKIFSFLFPQKTYYPQYNYDKLTKRQQEIENLVLSGILDRDIRKKV
jgi:integral membrane protein (TIGR01906 family)